MYIIYFHKIHLDICLEYQICSSFFPSFSTISSSGISCSSLSSRVNSSCGDDIDNDGGGDDNVGDDAGDDDDNVDDDGGGDDNVDNDGGGDDNVVDDDDYDIYEKIDLAEMVDNARPNGIS